MTPLPQIRLLEGDSLDVLRAAPDHTYTFVVTDPPYGLSTPPDPLEVMRQWLADGDFVRKTRNGKDAAKKGFMQHSWDDFVPGPVLWREVFRTCKPGAIVLCFAATRTMDWMSLSLRCAGFEILDTIAWLQAQGMAKAGTIDKKIDARNGDEREVVGSKLDCPGYHLHPSEGGPTMGDGVGSHTVEQRLAASQITAPASAESAAWAGWSTQLAPGFEPIIVARRPCEGTATANVLKHGCGAMNIDACRIETGADYHDLKVTQGRNTGGAVAVSGASGEGEVRAFVPAAGRWPKNVLLDSSAAEVLDLQVGERKSGSRKAGARTGIGYGSNATGDGGPAIEASTGGPSRFFWVGPLATEDDCAMPGRYVPKVRTAERHAGLPAGVANPHPTLKPIALMEWLCRLVGHPNGRGLDPFAGSGSTLRAARTLGLSMDGIERDPAFAEIARHRSGVHDEAPMHLEVGPVAEPEVFEWDSALEREPCFF